MNSIFPGKRLPRSHERGYVTGAAWTVGAAAVNKGVTLAGQIALTWYLVPKEMGLVALALSISSIGALISVGSLKDLLVQRQRQFDQDVSSAFWLAVASSLLLAAIASLLAPAFGRWFREPRVVPLMWVVASTWPIAALATPFAAKLYIELRFKTLAWIFLFQGLLQTGVSVGLAALGWGAWSMVLALVPATVFGVAAIAWTAGTVRIRFPTFHGGPELIRAVLLLSLGGLFVSLQLYGVQWLIGFYHPASVVGLYFWGYQLATQIPFLLGSNLQNVLFPGLARLNSDPDAQCRLYRRSIRTLLLIMIPAMTLQAMLARPVVRLIFPPQWHAGANVLFWLSLGFMLQPLQIMGAAMLTAQGRFARLTTVTAAQTLILLASVWIGCRMGAEEAIAMAVAGASLVNCGLVAALVTAWKSE